MRTTDSLVPVSNLARFPVTSWVGSVVGSLSTLVPLVLLVVLIVILFSIGTGLLIELAPSRVMTTKVGVSRLVRVLEWAAARSVAEMRSTSSRVVVN